MNVNTTFCEECRDDVSYILKEEIMEDNLKARLYKYKGKRASCKTCNREVYVSKIMDYNLGCLYNELEKLNNN